MQCQRCQRNISDTDSFEHLGQVLCEDCYFDARSPNRTCDPWAVYAASRTRQATGASEAEGLTSLQQAIYAFVKNRGKVTGEEIITKFSLSPRDMQNQFATLRHCELIKGRKEGDTLYIVPFAD
jgi:hypothetical protein